MDILCEKRGKNLVVKIFGEIDHHVAGELRDKIDGELKRSRCKNILFDFSEVEFMDSSGIGMIMGRYKHVAEMGGQVAVANMRPEVERIFTISGLHKIIKAYRNLVEAEALNGGI